MSMADVRSTAVFIGLFLATAVALEVFIAILNALAVGPGSPVVQ